ncbi:hypothetical protein QR90_02885 [Deinococcus radiopugnans]|uniref:DinB superfamily protein n=1 Tax=Deinococcus radiopugnans TaxID=57497 RepID=A0A0A7KI92_9DEIO|nr:hypothetical protein [Deinococcus radiopugnans]AIZ44283.1 hypothetical protein QR90_02885 [Deinococcus radiopugnans]
MPLVQAFLDDLAQLGRIAQDERELERLLSLPTATESGWTVGYRLALSVAKHNTSHGGQIARIRQILSAQI